VEEQFYLVFPALFIFAIKRHGLILKGRRISWVSRVITLVLFLTLTSFSYSVIQSFSNPQSAYFSSLTRAWELGIGALLALMPYQKKISTLPISRSILHVIGLSLIISSSVFIAGDGTFSAILLLIPVLGTSLILSADPSRLEATDTRQDPAIVKESIGLDSGEKSTKSTQNKTRMSSFLTLRPIRYIGKISFSLYLWHWPAIIFIGDRYPDWLATWYGKSAFVILIVMLSGLSYSLIETPFRTMTIERSFYRSQEDFEEKKIRISRGSISVIALALVTVMATVFVFASKTPDSELVPYSQNVPTQTTSSATPTQTPPTSEATQIPPELTDTAKTSTLLASWESKIRVGNSMTKFPPELISSIGHGWARIGQYKTVYDVNLSTNSPSLYVIGESTAPTFGDFVYEKFPGWSIHMRGFTGCGIDGIWDEKVDERWSDTLKNKCKSSWSDLKQELDKNQPKLIILIGRSYVPERFKSSIKYLRSMTENLLYIDQRPIAVRASLKTCLSSNNELTTSCFVEISTNDLKSAKLRASITESAGGFYLDTTPWVCIDGKCPLVIDNTIVLIDFSYHTAAAVKKFEPLFDEWLKNNPLFQKAIS
jgi:peptidoglycan/LPS O-acetylase OafA/YrhL